MRHLPARPLLARLALLGALALVLAPPLQAQPGTWRAFPAFNEVVALSSSPDAVWAGAQSGVFAYRPASGEIEQFSVTDGLHGGILRAIAYDRTRDAVWAGFEDGVLNRIDVRSGQITAAFDIARATQYASRGVNRIVVRGDSLLVATAFGLVVYDAARGEVRNTYARLGPLQAATAVNDALVAPLPEGGTGLWLATDGGLVRAPLASPNLQAPSAWTREAGLGGAALSVAFFEGAVHAGAGPAGARDLYRRGPDGAWTRVLFTDAPVSALFVDGARLIAVTPFFTFRVRNGQRQGFYVATEAAQMRAVTSGPDGRLWGGDAAAGLFAFPAPRPANDADPFAPQPVLPGGPFSNLIADVAVGADGTVWTVSQPVGGIAAVSRFQDGVWTTIRNRQAGVDLPRNGLVSASVGPDGTFYAGSDGDGLGVVAPDGAVRTFREANSSLLPATGIPGYVVVTDVAFEPGGRRWVVNFQTARPLHYLSPEGTWAAPAPPAGYPAGAVARRLAIDAFGQKWLTLDGRGLVAWNTGTDPASAADDRIRLYNQVGPVGQNLPDGIVRNVALDAQGRVWIATARGLATIFSPGSAFGADAALAQPQWARAADGTLLLRDVDAADFALDPAGRLWVATTSGAYLLNAEGNAVVTHHTAANSPLPTDAVRAVAVDGRSGRVYFVTERGLFAYDGDATGPEPASAALRVAPAPYRPAEHADGVLVSGLRAARSQVRILTVNGEVVWTGEVAGGSFRWDGRDGRSGEPVRSGVYVVAAAGEEGGAVYGRIAVIR